jgi:hypothetical protein
MGAPAGGAYGGIASRFLGIAIGGTEKLCGVSGRVGAGGAGTTGGIAGSGIACCGIGCCGITWGGIACGGIAGGIPC